MKNKRPIILFFIFILLFNFFTGCTTKPSSKQSVSEPDLKEDSPPVLFSKDSLVHKIYEIDLPQYSIYESELIDTYLISCAIYFNFDSEELLPNIEDDTFYKTVKEYFEPFQEHPFIKNLRNYVDEQNHTQRGGVIYPLLVYAFSEVDYNESVDYIQSDVFQNAEEFNTFLKSLYQFYVDSKAGEFFQSIQLQKDMCSYIQKNIETVPIKKLLSEMEAYVGNKDTLFQGQTVKYCSVMTLYRPFNASFYTFNFGNDTYLVGQQSPHDVSRKSDSFDINQTVNTTIHEFLHNFINQPVYELNDLILELSKDKKKSDYTNSMYQNMEWNRIVDETIVRVVETSIYKNVLNNKKKAFELILNKEIQFSGMPKLEDMYNSLSKYNVKRTKYKTINDYLSVLIKIMFS